MKIYSVYDPEFTAYGQIVSGLDDAVKAIMEALPLNRCLQGLVTFPLSLFCNPCPQQRRLAITALAV